MTTKTTTKKATVDIRTVDAKNIITPNINFSVIERPVSVNGKIIEGYSAMVRQDTKETIAINGARYKIVDHKENLIKLGAALSKISPFTVTHKVHNARIYSRFHLNNVDIFGKSNKTEGSKIAVNAYNSYDGSLMFGIDFSVWRKICSNGMFGYAKEIKIKHMHTTNVDPDKIVKDIAPLIAKAKEKYEKLYKLLSARPVLKKEVLEKNFRKKLIDRARREYPTEKKLVGKDNAWVQLQSFTRVLTHDKDITEKYRIKKISQVVGLFQEVYTK